MGLDQNSTSLKHLLSNCCITYSDTFVLGLSAEPTRMAVSLSLLVGGIIELDSISK